MFSTKFKIFGNAMLQGHSMILATFLYYIYQLMLTKKVCFLFSKFYMILLWCVRVGGCAGGCLRAMHDYVYNITPL